MKNNFNLTEVQFNELKEELILGNEKLFKQVFLSHFNICCNFLKSKYKCQESDAHDAAMEALLIFRKRILSRKVEYGNLKYLFNKIASQELIKGIKKQEAEKNKIKNINESPTATKKDHELLQLALSKIEAPCRQLLIRSYYDAVDLKDIAVATNKNYDAIRKQRHRCIQKLKSILLQYSRARK